jgi:hypothetical protein
MGTTLFLSAPMTNLAHRSLPSWWALVGFNAALLGIYALAAVFDARELAGHSVWLKPGKFALSFVLLFATMAWVVQRLSASVQQGRAARTTLAAMTVACWGEMAYLTLQAGRGVHSHYNNSTPWEAAMYTVMGIGAVILVLGIGAIGVLTARDHHARLGPALKAGIVWGFGLSAGLTLITAGYLSSQPGHFVGTPPPGAATVPIFGWSLAVGDLRPAHFLSLHAMQALPLLGWWMDQRATSRRTPSMRLAALAYTALTLGVFAQALMGLPLLPVV